MKYFIVAAIFSVTTTRVFANVCKDLANYIDKEYSIEEINACHECEWHKVTTDRRGPLESAGDFEEYRVGSNGRGWCGSDGGGDYLEISFNRKMKIGGLSIQGAVDLEEGLTAWVTSFQVSYDDGTGEFYFIKDENGPMTFQGNRDETNAVEKKFPVPVAAVSVRVIPITDHEEPCMKVDIYACNFEDASFAPRGLSDEIRFSNCYVNVLEDCGGLKCPGTKFKRDMYNCEMCECEEEMPRGNFESDIDISQMPTNILRETYGAKDTSPDKVLKAAGREGRIARWNDYKRNGKILIPYTTSYGLSSRAPAAIQSAIKHLSDKTCIQLVKRSNEPYFINFRNSGGCSSPVGKYRGGNQVSIGYGCEHTGVVVHEILHSLGFWHEQSRPDRDSYVRIQTRNIRSGMAYNFQKRSTSDIDSMGSPYDLSSVMHYGATAFSANGQPTIVSLRGGTLGQRRGLTTEDINQINKMYGCQTTGATTTNPGTRSTTQPTATTRTTTRRPTTNCRDQNQYCSYWAGIGECDKNPRYMKVFCKKSCNVCEGSSSSCRDNVTSCSRWTRYCAQSAYASFMKRNCQKTCRMCTK